MRWQDLHMRHRSAARNAERVPFLSPNLERTNMHTIHLPHPVLAPAAAAMETAIHFELVDTVEMQSYCIEPVAEGLAMIGRYGDDLRRSPSAAFVTWDGASYLAIDYPDEQMIHIVDVTTNLVCKSIGDDDTAAIMTPIHRGSRASYRPDMHEMRRYLLDTVFETAAMRQKRHAALVEEMRKDGSLFDC